MTNSDPAPAPYVQGLVEWSGEHYLEVGGLATGPDWTNSETHAALTLLGWSSGSEDSGANLTRHFDTTWTGLAVSESVLSLFASIYGFTLDVPVSFDGTDEIRKIARHWPAVVSEPDVVITPGYDRPITSVSLPESEVDDESEPMMGHARDFGDDLSASSRDAIRDAVESLGFSRHIADFVVTEFERQFFDGPPSHDLDGVCEPAEEADPILDVVQVKTLLERSNEELDHLGRAAQALESMTAQREHVDDFVELWAVLAATNPKQSLDAHTRCTNSCILNHTLTRLLVAACSDDAETVFALKYDSCALVRVAAQGRTITDTIAQNTNLERKRAEASGCGTACENGYRDLTTALAHASLKIPVVPLVIAQDVRKFDVWQWATQATPTAMGDYHPGHFEYLRGPVPDQFALSNGGHGANSYSLNIRLAVGDVAMLAQTHWGGAYTGAPPSTPQWLAMCEVAERLTRFADTTWNPRRWNRRSWLVTFSDFRDGGPVPVGAWGLEWIGEGEPPNGGPRRSSAVSTEQVAALLEKVVQGDLL